MFATAVVSVALLAVGSASASAITARHPLHGLLQIRQSSGFDPSEIPTQCQSQCLTTIAVLGDSSTCTDVSCLCTSNVNTGFQQCLNCVLQVDGTTPALTQQAQDALAQYEDACKTAGAPLASLSISGATPGPTGSSGSSRPPSSSSPTSSQSVFFSSSGTEITTPTIAPISTPSGRTTITALPTTVTTPPASPTSSTSAGGGSAGSGGGGLASGSGALEGAMVSKVVVLGVAVVAGVVLGF